ncbi:MAG TPA: [protein-PII] uridylyltransferase, partial [Deltaproteobacteria bacterium]|nr:[protein-PII] uridylyltransferase [Deltaproteobacteria bacterium]
MSSEIQTSIQDSFEPIGWDAHDFVRYVPEILQNPLKEACQNFLFLCNQQLKLLHERNYHAEQLVGIRSAMIDKLLLHILETIEPEVRQKTSHRGPGVTLVAQGGYGRSEMNVYSDIDIVFLYSTKKGAYIETLTEKVLYLLWDLELEVGHATRTLADCKKMFQEDSTVLTALLDVRLLYGNESLFLELKKTLADYLKSSSNQQKTIQAKLDERKKRIAKYGGSVFVLEPNVKEGAGTLRDLQLLLWMAKIKGQKATYQDLIQNGYLDEDEEKKLVMARNFLWRIRNELHFLAERKADALTFQHQEVVAQKLGFKDSVDGILGVEQFMQTYYSLAYDVYTITDKVLRKMKAGGFGFHQLIQKITTRKIDDIFRIVEGQLSIKNRQVFIDFPVSMMRLFSHMQEKGLALHPETRDHVRSLVSTVNDDFRNNPENIKIFRAILNSYSNLGDVLMAMHETHFLDAWMPEFKKLRCRVQHDVYHIYTIDTHSIFAVNELSKLVRGDYDAKFPFYKEALQAVVHPELLTLGLFLHDIGKGEGGNHSVKGAVIARKITERLQYSQAEADAVDFLIQSHLIMPHLSQRRDLDDPELIIKFARSMGTMDNLNMLFLLTWGDIRAVGPEAWTDWKDVLLQKLYKRTHEVITKGEFSKEKTIERIARVKETIMSQFGDKYPKEDSQRFLSVMPPRYFFANEDRDIEKHFLMFEKSKTEKLVSDHRELGEFNLKEITIYTLNAPHVFSVITGVMLAHGINIIHADIFQTTHGYVLVILDVTFPVSRNSVGQQFESVQKALGDVLLGQTKIADLIDKQKIPDYLSKKPVQKANSKVVLDNDVSAYYTVIDVYAHDRLGLLYDIARVLNEHGCFIGLSKISTKVEQVTDVFYVKDIFGKKITAADKIKIIKNALQKVIDSQEEIKFSRSLSGK